MSTYMQGHHDSVLRSHRWRTAANSAAYLLPHLRPGMHVLDVGCGPGSITADLSAAVGPDGDVLGIDLSADVVAAAAVAAPSARFAVGDVGALEFPDGAFDVVHAHQVLQHLTDPVGALREMARVTRPGGLIAVRDADYAAMTWHPAAPALEQWRATYRSVAGSFGAEPDAGRRLLGWAQAAGLTDVVASASVWCFATPEDRQWWGSLQADRIVDSDIARHAVAASLAAEDDLRRMAAAWRAWAAAPDGWFAVLHGEVLCRVGGGHVTEPRPLVLQADPSSGRRGTNAYDEILRVPALSLGVFAAGPGHDDTQQPHREDEVYVVVSGTAVLVVDGSRTAVRAGSVAYVPAGVPHRFEEIGEDLRVVVVFAPPQS